MKLHLPLEQGFLRAFYFCWVVWVCLLLDHPIVVLDSEYRCIDVCLDVIAPAINIVTKLIYTSRTFAISDVTIT